MKKSISLKYKFDQFDVSLLNKSIKFLYIYYIYCITYILYIIHHIIFGPQDQSQLPSEQERVNCDLLAGIQHVESYDSPKEFNEGLLVFKASKPRQTEQTTLNSTNQRQNIISKSQMLKMHNSESTFRK